VPFLVTDVAAPDARFTTDVDFLVEVLTRSQYETATAKLLSRALVMTKTAQSAGLKKITSWSISCPQKKDILGFGSERSELAFQNFFSIKLPGGKVVRAVTAPCLLFMKFEAYNDRGQTNTKDLEDIIAVVNGRTELLDELHDAPEKFADMLSLKQSG